MAEPNAAQRSEWNGDGGVRWVSEAEHRDVILRPVLDELLAAADVAPDEDVLDVGCGCGAATLAVAAGLSTGTVTGIDISRTMLDVARGRAAGSDRISIVEADAQTHSFVSTYDVVISRFGTMFFDDVVGAFRNLRGATREGGRLCIATWQPLAANDWLLVPGRVLANYAPMPPTEDTGPGMFAQSDPATVRATLTAAGWREVTVEPRSIEMWLGDSLTDAVSYLAKTGIGHRMLEAVEPDRHAEALAAVADTLRGYDRDGVRLAGGINIVRASAAS